jgi:general secretion pathway protein A
MYNKFYGFREAPFNITPDPRFLFYSERHKEAFNHLTFGVKQRKGFIQITGEVGAGKTTLCRAFLESLDAGHRTALILNPVMTETQLLRTILAEFGLKAPRDRVSCLAALNDFLLEQMEEGRDVLLVIDEAQDLSIELLEQVRLLSNLETDQRKLLQIVLIGQPELRELLDRKSMRQLRQRITVRYHLDPLTRYETRFYIQHRLQVAGANSVPAFNSAAVLLIHRYSKGIPRLINAVCDKTLLAGFAAGSELLKGRHVMRAVRELEGRV